MKVAILPHFQGEDNGDGGIRRVVEAQHKWLPKFDIEVINDGTTLGADLVATHAGVRAPVGANVPVVNHCHGLYWTNYEWPNWALSMNRDVSAAMRRADVVTAPSEWVAQAIRRGSQIDPVVLYHGVDMAEWEPAPNHGGYVLWNNTRVDSVCDPAPVSALAKRAPNHSFITTFKDPFSPNNVNDTGALTYTEGKEIVKHAGVYLATARETFGIGTIEAMAAGVPVIGWDWGGQHEIVTHGVNGWLVPPNDYDGLLEGLERCLARRDEYGAAAREAVKDNFTWQKAMERYAILYRQLCNDHIMSGSPKVSVVIPCHNLGHFLKDAVESALTQLVDLEVIVVDDKSTDGSLKVARDLQELYPQDVRVIENAENVYLAEALNVGISAAKGRYILPLDADNMLAPACLPTLVDALEADRDVDIAYGAMSVIEPNGNEWVSDWPPQFEFRRQVKHQNQITSTAMYRKSVWHRVGGYRRRCRTAEDADFWCRATSFGANPKRVTDAVVLRYRNRDDSMSHVVADWPWHEWYPWGKQTSLTPWIAPIKNEPNFWPQIWPHENPIVSVIIPVGPGHERLVLDALDSLNAQTFIWWEAVVVNDTGGPIPWLPAWATLVEPGRDTAHGAGSSRNVGVSASRGRLLIFLDADDYLQPRALELMVEAHTKYGGFIYTDWFVQEDGRKYETPNWTGCDQVLHELPWSVTSLISREGFDRAGGFDEQLPAWEDWDFAIRLVQAGFCGTRLAVPLLHYRIGSGQRREAGYANREELKQVILDRWGKYIRREVEMPCGCGAGGGMPTPPPFEMGTMLTSLIDSGSTAAGDDLVAVQFMQEIAAPITYTGPATGTRYRFGSDADNNVRWVYPADAQHFLQREEFRQFNEALDSAPLVAAGPPTRS